MAQARLTVTSEPTVYHAITRTSRGQFLFGDLEKDRMRKMIWQMADFCGVEVLTYAVMSNHVHIVVRVPVKESMEAGAGVDGAAGIPAVAGADALVANAEVLRRYGVLYGKSAMQEAERNLMGATDEIWQDFRGKYVPLMHDLSWFMRLWKQRFARWFNAFHKTFGTLWAERFTSVIVEGDGDALLATCAYVDLNPLRAKLVSDPKDYRWSGYGEAVGGLAKARTGLARAAGEVGVGQLTRDELAWKFNQQATTSWKAVQARYRLILYAVGQVLKVKGGRAQGVISEEAGAVVKVAGGQLSWAVALRDRVRYFTRGGVLGTREFVDRIFGLKRDRFPEGRNDGARKMRGGDWGTMMALRDLRN
jgi:REP element-mobilizing transposase RayT